MMRSPSQPSISERKPAALDWYSGLAVFVGAALMTATLPGRTHGLGLITKRVIEDLTIDTVVFAQINFASTLLGALFCYPCGKLLDRLGMRTVASSVLILLAASLCIMSSARDATTFTVGMVLTRGFGQSMLSIISLTLVGRWFGSGVGKAMGAFALLMSFMMAAATGALASGVTELGWRAAWSLQAIGLLAALIPLWWLPEAPREHAMDELQASDAPSARACTLHEAVRTRCFWVFALSIAFFGLVSSGFTLFSQYVLAERGFGEKVFQMTLIVSLLAGMVCNLIAGWWLKRVRYERMLALGLVLLSGSLAMFPWIQAVWHTVAYGLLSGAAGGVLTVVYFSVWRHAFGAKHLGSIQAAAQIPTVLASALGPVLVAVSETSTGSYRQAFWIAAIAASGFALIAWFTRVPTGDRGEHEGTKG
ncbi:MAG: CynX/NimT family MFS transporter [Pirellula sp.]